MQFSVHIISRGIKILNANIYVNVVYVYVVYGANIYWLDGGEVKSGLPEGNNAVEFILMMHY